MRLRGSTLVRWTEQAEAEQMCAMAMVERAPQEVAACPLTGTPRAAAVHHSPGPLSRLRCWLAGERPLMTRDAGR